MQVLPLGALDEMRAQVFARRSAVVPQAAAAPATPVNDAPSFACAPAIYCSRASSKRGLVIVGAAFGLL